MATARQQTQDPSLHAVLFQSLSLLDRLRALSESEYPPEALGIRDIFVLIVEQVRRRLWAIHKQRPRNAASQIDQSLGEADAENVIQLGQSVQTIHACLRYLESSGPPSTPPEIQTAITALVRQHVPQALSCNPVDVVVLVRPQWTYNLKYVNLLSHLEKLIEFAVLDPQGDFSTSDFRSFLSALWAKHGPQNGCLPRHVAVISFAGLDGHDALVYPLLAHELGHLIDFSYEQTIYNNPRLQGELHVVTFDDTADIFNRFYAPNPPSVALEPYRAEEINRLRTRINEHIQVCLQELTADLLATRMIGLPYFIAMAEYLKATFQWPQDAIDSTSGYPGMAYRLGIVFQELTDAAAGLDAGGQLRRLLKRCSSPAARSAMQRGLDYLKEWEERLAKLPSPDAVLTTLHARLAHLVQERSERMLPNLRQLIREVIPSGQLPSLGDRLEDLITLLKERVPPAQPLIHREEDLRDGLTDAGFSDVLAAGWLYELGLGEEIGERSTSDEAARREYQNTCQLLFKAVELHGARAAIQRLDAEALTPAPARSQAVSAGGSGAVSGPLLVEALRRDNLSHRLFIVPYYGLRPVQAATVDIRLGNWFRIARRTRSTSIDLTDRTQWERVRREQQSEVYVPFGPSFFTLHPGDFALAISLEYVAIPPDVIAFVEGKSGLGRAGLIVATATQVAPGFKGGVVLELCNSGTVPLILRPGMQIAQLAFFHTDHPLSAEWLYSGKFHCQVKP